MQRVAIVGPGAMGTFFAAALAPVAEVTLVGLRPEWAAAVGERGIACQGWPAGTPVTDVRIITRGPAPATRPVQAVTDAAEAGPVDLIILLVKSGQTEAAWPAVQQLLASGARAVLSLQNGLSHIDALVTACGWDRLILGTCTYGVTRIDDTMCRLAGEGDILLGSSPAAPTGPEVMRLLQRAGLRASTAPDTLGAVWQKALINAGINPLTSLLNVPNGALLERAAVRTILTEAVTEGAAVAAACGIVLPGDPVAATVDVAMRTAGNLSSMLQDVRAGRRTEVAAINGEIVRLGREAGVPTPVNEALVELVLTKEGV